MGLVLGRRRPAQVVRVFGFRCARWRTMNYENEINELKRRVGDLEGAVNALAGRAAIAQPGLELREIIVQHLENIEDAMTSLVKRLDTVNTQIWGLRDDFPELLGDAMRRSRELDQR